MSNHRIRPQQRCSAFGANQTALGTGAWKESTDDGREKLMLFFFGNWGNTRPKAQANKAVQGRPAKPQQSGLSGSLDGLGSDATGMKGARWNNSQK